LSVGVDVLIPLSWWIIASGLRPARSDTETSLPIASQYPAETPPLLPIFKNTSAIPSSSSLMVT